MLLGDVGAFLHKGLSELASMSVDEFNFWVAYIAVKNGNDKS